MQRLLIPFVAGFLAVLFFQQAAIGLLHAANIGARIAFDTTAAAPSGVPAFVQDAVLGGLIAILATWVLRIDSAPSAPWLGATLFGAFAMTGLTIFVVGPLSGVWPTGYLLPRLGSAFVVNAVWGWGTLVMIRAFMRDVA
ncbi:hypothetical protein [Chitinasiproducens palmae]|uniref:Transmembrane protein n=1 Tax=Chitinasiproducens palmae TaxID=1770053 RepID=A0A1H2PSE1_9BURK|nr:hypothetical protein [Chitinasiproducens palmae]SDV49850.1 hypothetical protein SAMN05216551_109193 [Chitinasiproducens palmae]